MSEIPTIDELKAVGMTHEQAEKFIADATSYRVCFTKSVYLEIANVIKDR